MSDAEANALFQEIEEELVDEATRKKLFLVRQESSRNQNFNYGEFATIRSRQVQPSVIPLKNNNLLCKTTNQI